MARRNFFESMERELNLQYEYEKIEEIVLNENVTGYYTLEEQISKCFREWSGRKNFISFDELRTYLGFTYKVDNSRRLEYHPTGKIQGIDDFLLYCEMMLNVLCNLLDSGSGPLVQKSVKSIIETMQFDLEKINHEIYVDDDGDVFVVQKNAATAAVADIVEPELADEIIRYNHHLLNGDIAAKKAILKNIADAIEPKRQELKGINKTIESDLFYMINNFNIRHNNCDINDPSKYNEKFAKLTQEQQEEWYDEVYLQALYAFLSIEQVERTKRIDLFKKS